MEISTILSITLTATISSLSLIVSVITVFLNNRHQKQIKILDITYEKKYKTYQEFFDIYADYCLTKELNIETLSKVITNCLLVSNKTTSSCLDSFLINITNKPKQNKDENKNHPLNKYYFLDTTVDYFRACIKYMKEELKLS